jgi:hypothetical protein
MDELQALPSPTSLPCNSSTNPADVEFASLQLTVLNITQTTVDLTQSGLQFEFVVDPGGTGSASALILSQYSGDEPGTGSPAPSFPVEASAALGTAWTISQTPDAPCAFLAIPESGQGQLAAGASVSFVFANIAANLVPGASPVTVTVLPGSTATVAETPVVSKTGPAVAITSFTPSPLQLDPPDNQLTLTWSTVGAATCQLDWDQQDTTVVVYNGQQVSAPWTAPPQVTAQAPVTATLFQDTQFTLSAGGAAPVTAQQTVQLSPVSFTPSVVTVPPWQQFTLNWSAFTGMGISMTWQPAPNVTVASASSAGASPIQQGAPLDIYGTVVATIPAATTFFLDVTGADPPLPAQVPLNQLAVQVSTEPVSLSNFAASGPQIIDAATGQQAVTLSWTAQNAAAITITGDDGSSASPAYNASSADFTLPLPLRPVTYTITAQGNTPTGTPLTASCTVVPLPLEFGGFTAGPPAVADSATGQQAVTLSWYAQNATGFSITGTDGSAVRPPANAASALLYLPMPAVPVTYAITPEGYTPSGVLTTETVLVTPNPVGGLSLSANPLHVSDSGTPVTLSWEAAYATGFTLVGTLLNLTVSDPDFLVGNFPPDVTRFATTVSTTVTFQITASGFTAGGQDPTAAVTVTAPKREKDKDKEDLLEKQSKDHEIQTLPGLSTGESDAADPGLPGGSQQAFISPDERPDVGAHLRNDDPGA